ncbi:MAG: serine protease, partial [bacterium]|nr:serine protease [bacterium]
DIVGFGTVLAPTGLIASDVNVKNYAAEAKYFAVLYDGKEVPIALALEDKSGLFFFQAALPEGYKADAVALGNSDKLKLGQAVLVIAPSGELQKGIISGLVKDSTAETATSTPENQVTSVKLIKLSIALSLENSGSPLVSLGGETVGVTFYRDGAKVSVPSNVIKEGMAALSAAGR